MAGTDGFLVDLTARDGHPLLVVHGEIDMSTAPVFAQALRIEADGSDEGELRVDLTNVSFMDSSGVGALVKLARTEVVRIVAASPAVQRVLQLSGLEAIMSDPGQQPTPIPT
jgi:anti-sigma B factor antagonist